MLHEISTRYHSGILSELATRYGISPDDARDLGGFESHVFHYEKDGQGRILKITHSLRRTTDYLMGELEWIQVLKNTGLNVPGVIPSEKKNLLETLSDGDDHYFVAVAYEEVKGKEPKSEDLSPQVMEDLGRMMGKMHQLAQAYKPSLPQYQRNQWHQDPLFKKHQELIPLDQTYIRKRVADLLQEISQFEKTPETYGLLHGDIHQGNFYVQDNCRVVLFDFDDCEYSYYANDIGIMLYYFTRWRGEQTPEEIVRQVLPPFLKGYGKEKELDREWILRLPHFIHLRQILLYLLFYHYWPEEIRTEKQRENLAHRKKQLESGLPLVDLDFGEFA